MLYKEICPLMGYLLFLRCNKVLNPMPFRPPQALSGKALTLKPVPSNSLGWTISLFCGLCEVERQAKDMLTRLPTQRASEIDQLLPHRWQPV